MGFDINQRQRKTASMAVAAGVRSRAGKMVGNRYIWTVRDAADAGCPRDRITEYLPLYS